MKNFLRKLFKKKETGHLELWVGSKNKNAVKVETRAFKIAEKINFSLKINESIDFEGYSVRVYSTTLTPLQMSMMEVNIHKELMETENES